MFTCQQPGGLSRWDVTLPASRKISQSVSYTRIGVVLNFMNDPGFEFEIYVLNSSSSSSVLSELRVTAVSQLNGVTVECVDQMELLCLLL